MAFYDLELVHLRKLRGTKILSCKKFIRQNILCILQRLLYFQPFIFTLAKFAVSYTILVILFVKCPSKISAIFCCRVNAPLLDLNNVKWGGCFRVSCCGFFLCCCQFFSCCCHFFCCCRCMCRGCCCCGRSDAILMSICA